MSDKQLLETAAEILNGSKQKAPTMPPQKLPGTEEDLGGPTPQDSKPTDDSNKLDTNKAAPKTVEHNRSTIKAKKSNASGTPASTDLRQEDAEDTQDYSEDVDAIFENTVSEDFKQKAAVIFEARVQDRVNQIQEQLETEYTKNLQEAVKEIQEELQEKIDTYLSYVIDEWMEDNKLAIEAGLRTELAEEFIGGLHKLFSEHYINVPEDKVNLVDELSEQVVNLTEKLNEQTEKTLEYRKALVESRKKEIASEICEGLSATQAEKIKSLAESVDFISEDDFQSKVQTIRENYFPKIQGITKASLDQLNEHIEQEPEAPKAHDPMVDLVSRAISKSKTF